jgi:hypothetical protein
MGQRMDIAHIRELFRQGRFNFYFHAFQEALKDGITGDDILYVVEHGEIIEEYPDRERCLLFANTRSDMPLHVVVDYSCEDELQVVTTYVPDRHEWIAFRRRRR